VAAALASTSAAASSSATRRRSADCEVSNLPLCYLVQSANEVEQSVCSRRLSAWQPSAMFKTSLPSTHASFARPLSTHVSANAEEARNASCPANATSRDRIHFALSVVQSIVTSMPTTQLSEPASRGMRAPLIRTLRLPKLRAQHFDPH
jgi:hypothetical protein